MPRTVRFMHLVSTGVQEQSAKVVNKTADSRTPQADFTPLDSYSEAAPHVPVAELDDSSASKQKRSSLVAATPMPLEDYCVDDVQGRWEQDFAESSAGSCSGEELNEEAPCETGEKSLLPAGARSTQCMWVLREDLHPDESAALSGSVSSECAASSFGTPLPPWALGAQTMHPMIR
eukprot:CAMPEP_0115320330 /NCGR_PEP_ID=MMETSP0270-20121206/80262_1 /TAXON_ID=71861 /ORGANISM="Scrippsiella trochoidea, Strain CCMP3099" /LENGTH=175 /DNA_ID=CAMNT_0002740123 /DNA_START=11 /DNA_END=535 /DNA_ORIENTATION=-